MGLMIQEVLTAKDKKKFIGFPHDLYANDPNYVPELNSSVQEILNPKKMPFSNIRKPLFFWPFRTTKRSGALQPSGTTTTISTISRMSAFLVFLMS